MNAQCTVNEPSMNVKYLLFDLESYGAKVNYKKEVVCIPYELQRNAKILQLSAEVRKYGWHTQIGIL